MATISIEEILVEMEELLDKKQAVPFSRVKYLVEADKLHDLIYEIRANMPTIIKDAQNLVADRKNLMKEANDDAQLIIKQAEERAKQMISHEDIVRLANARAEEVMINAQNKSKELRLTSNDYVDVMLAKAEDLFTKNLTDIKKARTALKNTVK